MRHLKLVAVYGLMQVMDVPPAARPLYRGCRYIVRNAATTRILEEFEKKNDAIAWAQQNCGR